MKDGESHFRVIVVEDVNDLKVVMSTHSVKLIIRRVM